MKTYERIVGLAKESGMSIRALEQRMGYSNGYIGSWKRQTPNSIELARLADYFHVSVDYLLGRTDNPKLAKGNSDSYEKELLMMFRKGENEVPEERRDLYRRQVTDLMGYISETMKEQDEKNKPK